MPEVEGGVSKTVPVIRDGDHVVANSFAIALYLDDAYPDRPTLFGGEGGKAMARFVERWSQLTVHPYLGAAALMDIHERLDRADKAYFRESREARFGKRLEEVAAARDAGLAASAPRWSRCAACSAISPSSAARRRSIADYIVFGAFQWVRVMSPYRMLADDDVGRGLVRALPRPAWRRSAAQRARRLHAGSP